MCQKEKEETNKNKNKTRRDRFLWRKEREILDSYLSALEKSCKGFSLKKNSYINPAVRDVRFRRPQEIMDTKLTHYEKLYRCYVDYHRSLRICIAIVIAAILISVTILFCTFGPEIKKESENMENRNSTSLSLQYDTEAPSALVILPEGRYAGR